MNRLHNIMEASDLVVIRGTVPVIKVNLPRQKRGQLS